MNAFWLDTTDNAQINAAELLDQGIYNAELPTEPADFQAPMDSLKSEHGYVTQDEVALKPDMPNLTEICNKFKDEHYHDEDEVRFVLSGAGIFDIRSNDNRWMRVEVSAGDLIGVPAKRYHRFFLTEENAIHCVRLYQDMTGWTPHYRNAA